MRPRSADTSEVDWVTRKRLAMDRAALGRRHGPGIIDRVADDVDDAAERAVADRHGDRPAGVADRHAAHQTLGRVHRDAAHGALAEVLRHLDDEVVLAVVDRRIGDREGVENLRQLAVLELDVEDGADDLRDLSDVTGAVRCHLSPPDSAKLQWGRHPLSASAPPAISMSS